jgi:hypothetical protein
MRSNLICTNFYFYNNNGSRYLWEINPPKDGDYMHLYNEIAEGCFNHTFDEKYAKV